MGVLSLVLRGATTVALEIKNGARKIAILIPPAVLVAGAIEGGAIWNFEKCRQTADPEVCSTVRKELPAPPQEPPVAEAVPESDESYLQCLHEVTGIDAGYNESNDMLAHCQHGRIRRVHRAPLEERPWS